MHDQTLAKNHDVLTPVRYKTIALSFTEKVQQSGNKITQR